MPVTNISGKIRDRSEKQELIQCVHQALIEAFGIPAGDKLIRYTPYCDEDFQVPEGRSDNYTLVEISIFPGRTLDAKRQLYQEIVTRFASLGIDPLDTRIVLYEIPKDDWGIRGGVPGSEVDLGYKLKV